MSSPEDVRNEALALSASVPKKYKGGIQHFFNNGMQGAIGYFRLVHAHSTESTIKAHAARGLECLEGLCVEMRELLK